jgi:hypothetical protein
MAFRFAKRVRYTEAVVPHHRDLGAVSGEFTFTLPENAIGILRLKPLQ